MHLFQANIFPLFNRELYNVSFLALAEHPFVVPSHQVVYEGKTATIKCRGVSLPSWTKDKKQVDKKYINGYNIEIKNVKEKNSGKYNCEGYDIYNQFRSETSELLVGSKPIFLKNY